VSRIVSLAAWWAAFVLLWIAFVGTTTRQEVLAGLGAAVVAVAALEVVRAQGLLHFRVDRRWLARAWSSPVQIVYDFALLTSLLFRRGRVEGEYLTVDFPAGDSHAQYAWRRAWVTTIGTISPNVVVVDIDPEQKTALLHSLDTGAWKGKQPL
jgi:multisubunit Na+/H+ antiporter MnhE subunit